MGQFSKGRTEGFGVEAGLDLQVKFQGFFSGDKRHGIGRNHRAQVVEHRYGKLVHPTASTKRCWTCLNPAAFEMCACGFHTCSECPVPVCPFQISGLCKPTGKVARTMQVKKGKDLVKKEQAMAKDLYHARKAGYKACGVSG